MAQALTNRQLWRRRLALLLCLFPLSLLLSANSTIRAQTVGVAMITDGSRGIIQQYQTLVRNELHDLLSDDFNLVIYSGRSWSNNWDYEAAGRLVERAYADDRIDIVISIGVLSTDWLLQQKSFSKPTIAALTLYPKAQNAPRKGEGSGVENLVYISQTINIENEINTYRSIIPFKQLGIVVENSILTTPSLNFFRSNMELMARELGYQVRFIPANDDPVEVLDTIKLKREELDALLLMPMTAMSSNELSWLADEVAMLKLPSYSLLGRADVNRGFLLASAPFSDAKRIARRIALNARDIVLGSSAGSLDVSFKSQSDLTLNEQTARKIGLPLSWNLLSKVSLVGGESQKGEALNLIEAVEEAIRRNLSLQQTSYDILLKKEDLWSAKSNLLPTASVGSTWVQIDEDRASLPGQNERELTGKFEINQLLFDVKAWSNFFIQKELLNGVTEDRLQAQLDTVLDTTKAYLGLLGAERLIKIEAENLELIKANLKQAQNRVSTGTSNKSEEYRWQSELASNEQRLLDATSQKRMALAQLNAQLNQPLDRELVLEDIDQEHPIFVFNRQLLDKYVNTVDKLQKFQEFLVGVSVERSPEIKSIDASIRAAEKALKSSRLLFLLPTIGLQLGYEKELSASGGSNDGAQLNNEESTIAINMSLPLDINLGMRSDLKAAAFQLNQLKVTRQQLVRGIEQRMLNSIFSVRASFPGIGLADASAEAARKNLKIISDAYARGTVSIVDLLDAQNASLVADQTASNAIYDYLQDLMELQRSMGGFVFLADEVGQQEFLDRLEGYYEE